MDINDVQEFSIEEGRQKLKFILVEVTNGIDKKLLVRMHHADNIYHVDMLHAMEADLKSSGLKAKGLGGGYADIYNSIKTIEIYGSSKGLGQEPDREETIRIVKRAFPGFQVS